MSLTADDLAIIESLIDQRTAQHMAPPIDDLRSRLTSEQDPEILAGRLRRLQQTVESKLGTSTGGNNGTTPGGGDTPPPPGSGPGDPPPGSDPPPPPAGGSDGGTPVTGGEPGEPFSPGDTWTPGAAVLFEARKRGGTASLVGFSEYTSPSTPAKKYRTKTLSGTAAGGVFTDAGFTPLMASGAGSSSASGSASSSASGMSLSWAWSWSGATNTMTTTFTLITPGTWKLEISIFIAGFHYIRNENIGSGAEAGGTFTQTWTLPVTANQLVHAAWNGRNARTGAAADFTPSYVDHIAGTQPVTESLAYGGAATYNATTGALTDAGTLTQSVINSTTGLLETFGVSSLASVDDALTRIGSGNFGSATEAATAHALPISGTAVQIGSLSLWRKLTSSTLTDTLSVEDTDSDAITRLLATSPAWSSWSTVSSFPGAAADYDARTAGFTFDYEGAQLRATYSGLPVGWPFKARVRIAKVNQTTGASSTVSLVDYRLLADGSGDATFTVDIQPTAPGFTWRVHSVAHYF